MWAVYTFIGYLILALAIPTVVALWPVWRRARVSRQVVCPATGALTLVRLDPRFAVGMHVLGNAEARVKHCERWPEHRDCGQDCLAQIGTAA